MRLLLDEMFPPALADMLAEQRAEPCATPTIDVATVRHLDLAGAPDERVFAAAQAQDRAIVTENVADFTRLAADHLLAGDHHAGVLISLSSRFSRRRAGLGPLATAIEAVTNEDLTDRVLYLQRQDPV